MNITIEINKEEIESISVLIDILSEMDGVSIGEIDQQVQYLMDLEKDNDEINDLYILMNQQNDFHLLSLVSLSNLSFNIFEKFSDKFNWEMISLLDLSEEFIEKHIDKLSDNVISSKQLSEKFIIKHSDKLNLSTVFLCNPVSDTLNELFHSEISDHNLEIVEKNYKFIIELEKLHLLGDDIDNAKTVLRDAGLELILNSPNDTSPLMSREDSGFPEEL